MSETVGYIYVDASSLNRVVEVLEGSPAEIQKTVGRILFRVRDNAKAEIIRQIPKIYAISPSMVRSAITRERRRFVRVGQEENEQISITVVGNPLNLVRFIHTPSKPLYGDSRLGVMSKVSITRSRGLQQIGGRWGKRFGDNPTPPMEKKNAFLMPTSRSSRDKIPFFFARRTGYPSSKNSKKEGIEPLASISVPQMMMNPVVSEKIRNYIEEQMAKRVEVELINSVVGMQQNVRR